jgi:hypothetical protein
MIPVQGPFRKLPSSEGWGRKVQRSLHLSSGKDSAHE